MRRRLLLTAVVAVHVIAAVVPLRFDVPRYVTNRVERRTDGTLTFDRHSIAVSARPPPWIDDVRSSGIITVNLRVRSTTADQHGPARILTLSDGFNERNVTVGQEGSDLIVRLRRPATDDNGEPAIVVDDVFAEARWVDLTIDVRPGTALITVDGAPAARLALPADALRFWDPTHRLALGNEVTGRRPWSGAIAVAVIRTSATVDDLLTPGRLERPDGWWHVPERLSRVATVEWPRDVWTGVLHMLGFVPVGWLLARREPSPRDRIPPTGWVAIIALLLELLKLTVAGRHPSLWNLGMRVLGGALGVAAHRRVDRSPGPAGDRPARGPV